MCFIVRDLKGGFMRCFIIHSKNVFYNFAVEEYFVNNFKEPIFLLWKNSPNIMVGRNQNTFSEINQKFCEDNKIDIVRRLSGGGAVYSSEENFQYTLVIDKLEKDKFGFRDLAEPLIGFLKNLGIDAEFTGRNDILIGGKKISGNAQYHFKNILLHHGTILFDVDIDTLTKALTPDITKLTSKGIKSVKSRVTTIKERLDNYDVDKFIDEFMKYNLSLFDENYYKELTENEEIEVLKLKKERWDKKEWNFGKNPKYSSKKKKKFDSGLVEINYEIKLGNISKIKIYGDFFSTVNVIELEEELINEKFEKENLKNILADMNVSNYINGVTNEEFIELIFK
jgi:lipoate-protein ligase A